MLKNKKKKVKINAYKVENYVSSTQRNMGVGDGDLRKTQTGREQF